MKMKSIVMPNDGEGEELKMKSIVMPNDGKGEESKKKSIVSKSRRCSPLPKKTQLRIISRLVLRGKKM